MERLTDEQLAALIARVDCMVQHGQAFEWEIQVCCALHDYQDLRASQPRVVEVDVRQVAECERVTVAWRSLTDGG
jgi:hypothetical protein